MKMPNCGKCPVSLSCWTNKLVLHGYKCPICNVYVIKCGEYVWYTITFEPSLTNLFCKYWYEKTHEDFRFNFTFARHEKTKEVMYCLCPCCRTRNNE